MLQKSFNNVRGPLQAKLLIDFAMLSGSSHFGDSWGNFPHVPRGDANGVFCACALWKVARKKSSCEIAICMHVTAQATTSSLHAANSIKQTRAAMAFCAVDGDYVSAVP